jgi:hypothetical protein
MNQEKLYVHVIYSNKTQVESGAFNQFGVVYRSTPGYHALFAARVLQEPYDVLAERKWGWTIRDLLDEVLDRQRRFIASSHYVDPRSASPNPHLRTLALRYIASPVTRQVDVVLMGKVFALEHEQALALASGWYEEVRMLFPPDYRLVPIESEQEFMHHSGQEFLQGVLSPSQLAEVRRFEMFLPRLREQDAREIDYLVYPFLWHRNGMEQVWQVMALCSTPVIVSVALRSAYLYEAEELHLARFYEAATKLANSQHVAEHIMGETATAIYADYLRSWIQPFLARVHIIAPERIPGALARATGCAVAYGTLTDSGQEEFPYPGYEIVVPNEEECAVARENVCLLEMNDWGPDQAAAPYRRFRYLTDVRGAQCAFRLPFVPRAGIPGVRIGNQADLKDAVKE